MSAIHTHLGFKKLTSENRHRLLTPDPPAISRFHRTSTPKYVHISSSKPLTSLTMLSRSILRTRSAVPSVSARRWTSDFSHLRAELQARKLPILYDEVVPRATHSLNISLAQFIPDNWLPNSTFEDGLPTPSSSLDLPPSHHLVYFNPALPPSKLLPDGTDPSQSPGDPFVRRMWAGGNVRWNKPVKVNGERYACVEGIRDVTIKGKPGQEKVFVGIERRVGIAGSRGEEEIRARLWADNEEDFAGADIVERRNIVFMYERTAEELEKTKQKGAAVPKDKMLKRTSHSFLSLLAYILP